MSAEPSKSSGDPETPGIRETSEADGTPAPAPARRKRSLPMFTEVIIALIAVALVQTFLIKPFGVPSQSMENTLQIGDRILVHMSNCWADLVRRRLRHREDAQREPGGRAGALYKPGKACGRSRWLVWRLVRIKNPPRCRTLDSLH